MVFLKSVIFSISENMVDIKVTCIMQIGIKQKWRLYHYENIFSLNPIFIFKIRPILSSKWKYPHNPTDYARDWLSCTEATSCLNFFIRLDEGGQLNPEQIYFSDCAEMSIILGFSPFPLNHDIVVINSRVKI